MNQELELRKLREQLQVGREWFQIMAEREKEIPFAYYLLEDVMKIPQEAAQRFGCKSQIEGFLGEDEASRYIPEEDLGKFKKNLKKMLNCPGKGAFDIRLRCKGACRWYRIIYSALGNDNKEVFCVVGKAEDIQEYRESVAKMKEELQKDAVTGLKNAFAVQFAIEECLEEEKEKAGALLLVKIEGMKQVFEKFGQVFGSAVLQNLGETIQKAFRNSDIVGRTGAEEFLVYMRGISESVASRKAEDICRKVSELYAGEGEDCSVFANAGLTYYPQDGDNYKELYRYAQTAVKYAARKGKNSIMAYEKRMKLVPDVLQTQTVGQEQEIIGKYDMDFLSFAFSLLSHSKDTNSAINLLLDRIGSRYDLSCVYIFEKDKENCCLIPTNLWERGEGIRRDMQPVFYGEEAAEGLFDEQGFLCVEDFDKMEETAKEYEMLFHKHIKSMIAYEFQDDILGEGSIYFCDCKRKRSWNIWEKSTLCECARLLSVFVFLRKEYFRDKERITDLLRRDQLTGLLNRHTFEEEVREYLKEEHENPIAITFSDINDFEYVNSNFGVEAGNQILCDYAKSLEQTEGMIFCCRIYSDYFLSLCTGRSRREIEENVKRSDNKFVKQQKLIYPASNLRLSTGICFVEEADEDIPGMIENANLARKRAKDQRNSQIEIYQSNFRMEKEHEQLVAGSIHEAIEKEQIELFLQPKFSLMTRRIIGAEALVRWRNDDGSLRSPAEFIPVLEKVGYIVEMDFYIYEQLLIHMQKWRREGKLLVPVSVNFSRRHVQHEDFVKRVCALAEQYDIEPGLIEIEITESSISENNQKMLDDMAKLQKNGFKVDIDDFGTGYSSLSMLLNAPVDTVKIDKSFLKNIDNSEKERRYIDHLAHLINAAEKEIVFEGVETEHQARILAECGYTMAQGFLFGRPIPAEEFDRTYMVQEKGNINPETH